MCPRRQGRLLAASLKSAAKSAIARTMTKSSKRSSFLPRLLRSRFISKPLLPLLHPPPLCRRRQSLSTLTHALLAVPPLRLRTRRSSARTILATSGATMKKIASSLDLLSAHAPALAPAHDPTPVPKSVPWSASLKAPEDTTITTTGTRRSTILSAPSAWKTASWSCTKSALIASPATPSQRESKRTRKVGSPSAYQPTDRPRSAAMQRPKYKILVLLLPLFVFTNVSSVSRSGR